MTPKHAPVEFFYREPNKATFTYFNGVSTPTDYVIVRGSYASIRLSISGVVKLDPRSAPAPTTAPVPVPVPVPAPVPVLPTPPALPTPAQQPVLVPPAHAPGRAPTTTDDDNPRIRALRAQEERALRAPEPPAYLRDFDSTEPLPLRTPSEALSDQLDAVLALATAPPAGPAHAARTGTCLRELGTLLASERDCSVELRQLDLGHGPERAALAPLLVRTVARAAPRAVRLEALRCASLLCPTNEDFARTFVCRGGLGALARAAGDAARASADSATAPTLVLALVACLRHMLASPCCVRAFVEPYPRIPASDASETGEAGAEGEGEGTETVVHVLTRLLAHCAATVPAMVEPAKLVLRVCRFYAQHIQPLVACIDASDNNKEKGTEEEVVARLTVLGAALEAVAQPEGLDDQRDRMELTGVVAGLQAGDFLGAAARLLARTDLHSARGHALVGALARCVRPLFSCRSGFFLLFNQCAAVKRLVHALQTPPPASPTPTSPSQPGPAARLARAIACRMHMARPMLAGADEGGALGAALSALEALAATSAAHDRALAHTVAACRPTAALVAEFTRTLEAHDHARLRTLLAVAARALLHQARHATPDYIDASARIHRILADSNSEDEDTVPADVRATMRALNELTRLPHLWAASTPTTRPVAELVRCLARPVLPAHLCVLVPALAILGSLARSPLAPHRTALLQPGVLAALAQILTDCTTYFTAAASPSVMSSTSNNIEDPIGVFAERCQMAWDVLPVARLAVELAHALQDMAHGTLAAPRLAACSVDLHLASCALPFCACTTRAAVPGAREAELTRLQTRTAALLARCDAPSCAHRTVAHLCDCALAAPRALAPALRLLARLVGTPLHRACSDFDALALRMARAAVRTHRAPLHEPLALVCTALAHARPPLPLHADVAALILDTAEASAGADADARAAARVLALLWCALDGAQAQQLPCAGRAAGWLRGVLTGPVGTEPVVLGLALGCARALLVAGCGGDADAAAKTVAEGVAACCIVPVHAAGDAATAAAGLAFFVHPDVLRACRTNSSTRAAVAGALAGAHDRVVALLGSLGTVQDAETAGTLARLCCCVCREHGDGQTLQVPEDVVHALEQAHPELAGVAEPENCCAEETLAEADEEEDTEAHVRSINDALLEAGVFEDSNSSVGSSDTAQQLLHRRPERAERPPALLAMARQQHHLGDYLTGSWRKVELGATSTFGAGRSLLPAP